MARKMSELLQIVLDNMEEHYCDGLCGLTRWLLILDIISEEEEKSIDNYINCSETTDYPDEAYKWNRGEKQPRIDWLKSEIEKLKSEGK